MLNPRRIAALIATLLFVAGCGCACGPIGPAPDLTTKDLAGTWASGDGAKVVLNADGTFSAEGLHTCFTDPADLSFSPDAGKGTWVLRDPETLYPYQRLDLHFAPPQNFFWRSWEANEEELFFLIGDPDSWDRCVLDRE